VSSVLHNSNDVITDSGTPAVKQVNDFMSDGCVTKSLLATLLTIEKQLYSVYLCGKSHHLKIAYQTFICKFNMETLAVSGMSENVKASFVLITFVVFISVVYGLA